MPNPHPGQAYLDAFDRREGDRRVADVERRTRTEETRRTAAATRPRSSRRYPNPSPSVARPNACPTCKAQPGEDCRTANGPVRWFHRTRG